MNFGHLTLRQAGPLDLQYLLNCRLLLSLDISCRMRERGESGAEGGGGGGEHLLTLDHDLRMWQRASEQARGGEGSERGGGLGGWGEREHSAHPGS